MDLETAADLIREDEEWDEIRNLMANDDEDDAYWEALADHYASMDYEPSPYDGTYSEM